MILGVRNTAEPFVHETGYVKFEIAIQSLEVVSRQLFIKFRKNIFKQDIKHYGLRSKFFIPSGVIKHFHNSGINPLL